VRVITAFLLALAGCTPIPRAFHCTDSQQCVGNGNNGTCEATGWCSFADASCASGRRYGQFAGDALGGACVSAGDACGVIGEACCPDGSCQAGLTCSAATNGVCVGCVTALALGDAHGCALVHDGSVACWGKGGSGQLGNGGSADAAAAVPVVDDHGKPIAPVLAIAAGAAHTCALRSDHTVVCWGANDAGQLGRGTMTAAEPVPAPVGLTSIVAIAAGARHTCAALDNGAVWCWGANDAGQLGPPPSAGATMPIEVVDKAGLPLDVVRVAAGATHTCAVGRDHTMTCWGSDTDGELGDGVSAATAQPVKAASLGAHVVAAAAGVHVTCAVTDDGKAACVGRNDQGQAGQAPGTTVAVPTAIALDLVTAAAVGGTQGCARRAGARLYCWGNGGAVMRVRDGVGAIAVGASDACSARASGVDCAAFGDPHLVCR
jgi:Regulator of Chromosome Condensation (RCC1) repeat protein